MHWRGPTLPITDHQAEYERAIASGAPLFELKKGVATTFVLPHDTERLQRGLADGWVPNDYHWNFDACRKACEGIKLDEIRRTTRRMHPDIPDAEIEAAIKRQLSTGTERDWLTVDGPNT